MTIALMKENEAEGNTEPVPRPGSTFLSKHQCSDGNNNMADSSDLTGTTPNASSSESNEDQPEQRGLPAVRPPPRPPAPSAEAVKRNSVYGRSNPAVKPSESSANNRTMTPTANGSVESFSSIFEDLDKMEPILMEGNQPDVNVQSVPRPGDGNSNTVVSSDLTDATENALQSSESNEDQAEQRGLPPVRPPPRPPAPSAEAVKRNSLYRRSSPAVKAALMEEKPSFSQPRDGNIDTADSSDSTDATENYSSPERNQYREQQRGLPPVRPPPRPPAPSAEAVKRNSFSRRSNTYPSVKLSELSGTSRTPTPTANGSEGSFSSIYKDLDETEPVIMDENQVEVQAPSVRHPGDSNNNMADSSHKTLTRENSSESNEDQPEQRLPPVRPPPRPPAPSAEAVKRNSVYGRSNPAVKLSALSSVKLPPRRPSRPLPPQRPALPPLYCDRLRLETAPDPENDTDTSQQSRSSSTSSMEQAPEHSHVYEDALDFAEAYSGNASPAVVPALQQPDLFNSPLECELSPQQNRPPTPPSFGSLTLLPSADADSLHNEAESPIYVEILPDESEEMHITSLLRWLRKVSKTDCMAPSLYGLSIDEEMRSFHKRAVNVTKALRLYNHLMIKRKDNLKNILSEFKAICGTLDKIQKKNRTMSIAGGTTGAVGGMTAVMGIALAPATIGASLVATLVGAGMVASAGAMGAHAAKANKKIVDRVTVEKLLYDYKANIIDLELCLHFILVGMNELRRHDVARLHRAGAEPEAVKMAHRSEAVYRYNTKNSRATSTPNTSEKLLLAFVKEMDQYFSERDVTLRKSTKSKFSGRVCLLAENLQDELDYLNDMWGIFSS